MESRMSIEESIKLAERLAKSSLMPEALKGKTDDVLAVILSGQELGLEPMQAIRGLTIIKGKISLQAETMLALVRKRRDVCEYFELVESTDTVATYKAKRSGQARETVMSFTLDMAKKAGLTSSAMYAKFPAAMLRARCASALVKSMFSDLALGLYESDSGEIGGEPTGPSTPDPIAPQAPAKASGFEPVNSILNDPNEPTEFEKLHIALEEADSLDLLQTVAAKIKASHQLSHIDGRERADLGEVYKARMKELATVALDKGAK